MANDVVLMAYNPANRFQKSDYEYLNSLKNNLLHLVIKSDCQAIFTSRLGCVNYTLQSGKMYILNNSLKVLNAYTHDEMTFELKPDPKSQPIIIEGEKGSLKLYFETECCTIISEDQTLFSVLFSKQMVTFAQTNNQEVFVNNCR